MDARQSDEIQAAHIWKPDVYDHPVEMLPIRLELLQGGQGGIRLQAGITGLPEGLAGHLPYHGFVLDDEKRGHEADRLGLAGSRRFSAMLQLRTELVVQSHPFLSLSRCSCKTVSAQRRPHGAYSSF